jgi:YHS domain-containing protein
MITALVASVILGQGAPLQAPRTICPVMGDNVNINAPHFAYKSSVFGICCAGCESRFKKDPEKYIGAKHEGGLIGYSSFDVVSREFIKPKNAAAYSDYKDVRYFFATKANKATFDKAPKTYVAVPAFESVGACPVSGEELAPGKAMAYLDAKAAVNGEETLVRFYFCCAECSGKFAKAQEKYAGSVKVAKAELHEID